MITATQIDAQNATARQNLQTDYDSLGERLARRGVDINAVKAQVTA